MKSWDTARMLAGTCIIYGLVSACSGASAGPAFADTTSSGTGGGASCECAPKAPDVAVETCDKMIADVGTNQPHAYAQHAYAGASAVELANVVALGPTAGTVEAPVGSTLGNRTVYLQDGIASVRCKSPDEVITFVRP